MSNPMNQEHLEVFYFKIMDTWHKFTDLHTQLYELTCQEYIDLLSSDLEALAQTVTHKENIISMIRKIENYRQEIIHELDQSYPKENISSVRDLIKFMRKDFDKDRVTHFENLNTLLIDVIEKIQEQNKKNQIFINKAITSLKEIKEGIMGKKTYSTYDSSGVTNTK